MREFPTTETASPALLVTRPLRFRRRLEAMAGQAGSLSYIGSLGRTTTHKLIAQHEEIERLNRNNSELMKLRAQVARLRQNQQESAQLKADGNNPKGLSGLFAEVFNDPESKKEMREETTETIRKSYASLFKQLNLTHLRFVTKLGLRQCG